MGPTSKLANLGTLLWCNNHNINGRRHPRPPRQRTLLTEEGRTLFLTRIRVDFSTELDSTVDASIATDCRYGKEHIISKMSAKALKVMSRIWRCVRVGVKLKMIHLSKQSILLNSTSPTCGWIVDRESIMRYVKGSIFLGVRITRQNRWVRVAWSQALQTGLHFFKDKESFWRVSKTWLQSSWGNSGEGLISDWHGYFTR